MLPTAVSRTATAAIVAVVLVAQTPAVLQRAALELQRGDARAAIGLLEPLLVQQPKDLRALTLMAMALAAAGRPTEARQRFHEALAIDPRYAPALRNLAIHEMSAGRPGDAKLHFESLLTLTPSDPLAHLALAEISFADRRYSDAAAHFGRSGDLYTHDANNVLKFGEALAHTKQADKAESVLALLPENAGAEQHFRAGLLLVRIARYEAGARAFEKAVAGHPDPYLAGYNLALAQLRAARHADAIRTAERLLASGHKKAELHNLLGHAYEAAGRTKEAYDSLRTATHLDPSDEANYLDLIEICLAHRNFDLALEIAEIGIGRLAASDRLVLQKGAVLAMKGQFPEAKAAFEQSARLAPKKTLPRVSLGLVLLQMDKPAEAVRVLRRSAAGANDYLVHWFLGEALNRAGVEPASAEEKEAVAALNRSVRLDPNAVQPRVLLAKLLARRGELDQSIEHLERALQLEPDHVGATYQLAQAYARKGYSKRSKELFAKVSKAKADEREQFTTRGLQMIVREGAR
jgi:tetratricopeptide (TPR) repeat protein